MEMDKSNKILMLAAAMLLVAGCASTEPAKQEEAAAAETKPAAEPKAAEADTSKKVEAAANGTYSVVRGDHLWGISSKSIIYGNPYQWPLIYKANRDKIKDADLIQPGQVFNISRNASAADVDAAVRHAKTRGAWKLGVTEESDKQYLAR
jgi:nucleoid-associated protein YgaU